ncbi:MAG: MlaD family protein [Chitinophagales bacterium]
MSKEIKVAIFVIVTLVVFILGMNFLKGKGFFDNNTHYYAIFDQIGGLYSSDPVVVNGFQVGKIGELHLIEKGANKGKILAELVIRDDIEVPKGSKAILFSADLLGEMNVKLLFDDKSTQNHVDGDTISTNIQGTILEELGGEITPLTDKLNLTLENVNKLFDFEKENNETLNYTLKSINELLDTYNNVGLTLNKRLDVQMAALDATLKNLESLTATLKNNEGNIDEILTNFNSLSSSLNELKLQETLNSVNSTVASLNDAVDKFSDPSNTVGALLNERSIYDNLEKSTESLNVLLNDVRVNPKRYININVFGGGKKKNEIPPLKASDLE